MSNSIEERVVSIKFNNAQFEAGIKTTMTSLDGLKKSLNFSGGIKALGDLDAATKNLTNVKFDNKGFADGVRATIETANDLKKNLKFDGPVKALGDLDAAGRKINLKLDAAGFQAGAKAIIDSASAIKQNLTFDSVQRGFGNLKTSVQSFSMQNVVTGLQNAGKAFSDLDLAGRAVNFLPVVEGAEQAKTSISAMSIAGIAALGALAFKAVSVGMSMGKSLFVDPAKSGLAEYETNLNSIQTILANTQSKGSTIKDVNAALEELNEYSDQTIYNFSEMARSIGTFTTAGVSLNDSTSSIKGLSNVAAMSGANATQAAGAMEQLSRAMSSGKVALQDWMSIETAGMASESFRNSLMETARTQGVAVDDMVKKHGSFRLSLQEGWLTTDIMTDTLKKFTGDLSNAQLKQMGYNDQQIKDIQTMAKTAKDAATKVKTFTQLVGTLKETSGSGWAKTAQLVLGDFEEARVMWTNVNNTLGGMIAASAESRNKMLGDWNKLGGRTAMIESVSNAFKALMGILNPITKAFREVFPPTTGKQLYDFTIIIRNLTRALIPGAEQVNLIHGTFKLLFTIIKIGVNIIKGAFGVIFAFFKAFATGGDSIKGSMKPVTDALAKITKSIEESKFVEKFFTVLAKAATILGNALRVAVGFIINMAITAYELVSAFMKLINWFGFVELAMDGFLAVVDFLGSSLKEAMTFIENLGITVRDTAKAFLEGGLDAAIKQVKKSLGALGDAGDVVMTRIRERLESFGRLGESIARIWDALKSAAMRFWEQIKPLRDAISELFRDLGVQLKAAFSDVNFNDTLDMVNTGLLAGLFLIFKGFFKKLLGMGDGVKEGLLKNLSTSVESINGVLESLSGTLEAMQQNLKADTLMKIAIAIGILAISVIALSLVDSGKLTKGLVAIGVMVFILSKAMDALSKISMGASFLKLPLIAASLILLSIALGLLVIPVVILSRLSWGELVKGLLGVAIMIGVLSKAVESMAKNPANLIATGVGLMAIAVAVRILADAVSVMGALSFGSLIKGLGGVAIVLLALSKTVASMSKNPGQLVATSVGIVAIAIGIKILASAVQDFGTMDIPTIIQGIIALGIVLKLLETFTKGVGSAKDMIQTAIAMTILGVSMKIIANAMGDFGRLSWEEIAKGLTVMAVALNSISNSLKRTPPNMLASAVGFIAIAAALKILASALKDFATMSWEDIGKAMTVLAVSMLVLSVALIAMEGTVTGAKAMAIAAVSLVLMAHALTMLGSLSWEQLLIGLAGLAGIFVVFGLAGLVLAPIVPIILALGIAMSLFGLGLMAVGIGTAIFVAGMIALTAASIALGPAIVVIVASVLALIPLAMAELGKGIVAFADVIGNAMPVFLNAFVALINTLLTAIDMVFPRIMSTLWMVIVGLVDLIVRAVPMFVIAGLKIVLGVFNGIANNIGKIVDAGSKIVTEFIDGIARNIGKIIDSGVNLIIKFIEGMARSIRNNSQRMTDAGLDLASAIIEGMVNGLGSMVNRVVSAVRDVANNVLNAAKDILGIRSPSREFFAIGMYTDMGFANGIDKYAHLGVDSVEAMGQSAMDVLKKTMSGMGDVASSNLDGSPTIRPVLDLSAIRRDAGLVSGILGTPNLDVSANYDRASSISAADAARREAAYADDRSTDAQALAGNVYNFTQNNTSPKALSAVELYRQTRNQISVVKKGGVLKDA